MLSGVKATVLMNNELVEFGPVVRPIENRTASWVRLLAHQFAENCIVGH